MKTADLVSTERKGTTIIYRLNMSVLEEALAGFMAMTGIGQTSDAPKTAPRRGKQESKA